MCVCVCVHIQCHSAPTAHSECTVPQPSCSPGWVTVTTASVRPVAGYSTPVSPSEPLCINLSSPGLGGLFPPALPTQPHCSPGHMPLPAARLLTAETFSMPAYPQMCRSVCLYPDGCFLLSWQLWTSSGLDSSANLPAIQ